MPDNVGLTYPVWFAYGIGHVLNDLCSSIWFSYTLLFFEFVLEFDNTLAGATIIIGQVADGISAPIVGILSDKKFESWFCKYGRRKTWHLIGTLCVVCSFPFIFSPYYGFQNLSLIQQLIYYSTFIVLFQFGWCCTQVSHLSLGPELSPDQHDRTSLISLRYSFTVLSNIIVYVIFFAVLHLKKKEKDDILGPQDKSKFQLLAWIVIFIGLIMSAIFHIVIKEKPVTFDDNEQICETNVHFKSLIRNFKIYNVACVYITSRLFVNLSQVYIPYYLQTYLQLLSKNLAIFPLVMFISSFITSIIIKQFNVEFGRRFTYVFGSVVGILACIWLHFGQEDDVYFRTYEIYGIVIAFGCASAVILVTSVGITTDLIGNNTNNGAFVYGIMSFGDKVANGIVVFIIQNLKIPNYKPYYRDALTISCSIVIIIGMITVLTVKSLESPYYSNVLLEEEEDKTTEEERNCS